MPKTFVYTAIIAKKQMPVGTSSFAISSVLPALPATRSVLILKGNAASERQDDHSSDQSGAVSLPDHYDHPELELSVRSVYTYLDMGILTARNIDLKRKVKFKPRNVHKTQISDRRVFQNRTYADFQQLHLSSFVEMDTVHSASGSSKTLPTFFFTREKLFLDFLMNRNTEGAVRLIFDRLEKRFGTYDFQSLFEYILTDRGSEFGDPESLETGFTGIQRTSIYYCDPMRSGQKDGLEQAHTMLRMILPKKKSFEFLTQWDVNLIVSHINSTPRESLQGRTPYDVALETLGEETLKAFQLRRIAPDEVNLTPKLIRFTK